MFLIQQRINAAKNVGKDRLGKPEIGSVSCWSRKSATWLLLRSTQHTGACRADLQSSYASSGSGVGTRASYTDSPLRQAGMFPMGALVTRCGPAATRAPSPAMGGAQSLHTDPTPRRTGFTPPSPRNKGGVKPIQPQATRAARRYCNFKTVIRCRHRTHPLPEQSAKAHTEGLPGMRVVAPGGWSGCRFEPLVLRKARSRIIRPSGRSRSCAPIQAAKNARHN